MIRKLSSNFIVIGNPLKKNDYSFILQRQNTKRLMGKKNKQRSGKTFDGQELQNQDDVVEQVRRSAA